MALPLFPAQPLKSPQTDIVLVRSPLVRKVSQLHGLHVSVHNHRGSQTGSQSKKQHPPLLVASQGLHGRIVDHLHRDRECLLKVKTHPSGGQIMWLRNRPPLRHHPGITNRYHIVLPLPGQLSGLGDHPFRRQLRTRDELPRLVLSRGQNLDVGAAYIHSQHIHYDAPFFRAALFDAITPSSSFQESSNDFAPSSCSFAPSASTSTPALANCASTCSQSPPSAGSTPPMSPWSPSAFNVPSGIVFTVFGAANDLM